MTFACNFLNLSKFTIMNNIVFTCEARTALKEKLKDVKPSDVFVLVDNNSRNYCFRNMNLGFVPQENIITLPEGEHNKSIENVVHIWHVLSVNRARRNSVIVNIGGGLITDIGGFAASCFKRGIRCINVPTTLLAQVDASVGGKTGINFDGLKNEVGTFSIPECVIIDNYFLNTLPVRQVLSGFAEMLKHALLSDEEHLSEIMNVDLSEVAQPEFLPLIEKSVAVKATIVENDPREKGLRKALNFGHTIGHAIESIAIRKALDIYHGDAVAYGMIAELFLSVKKLGFDRKYYEAVKKFICEKYPVYHAVEEPEELYELMLHDKKNEREGVNFTLLRGPGAVEIDQYCSREEIMEALEQI